MNEKQLPCLCDAAAAKDPSSWLHQQGVTNIRVELVVRDTKHEASDDVEYLITRYDGAQAVLSVSRATEPAFAPRHAFTVLGSGPKPSLEFDRGLADALSAKNADLE